MKLIFDASPLIYFARSGVLHLIKELHADNLLSPVIYNEVVTIGRTQGYPDAEIMDQLIDQGLFSICTPKRRCIKKFIGLKKDLHMGEMEVLALADEMHGIAIIDDRIGREIGEMFRIEVRGSAFILFTLVRKKILSGEDAKQILRVMIREGFRMGVEQYDAFLDLLDQIPDQNGTR